MMMQARDICKDFNGQTVLERLNMSVVSGELLAIVGPSGAGKTTLLRVISGLTRPDQGEVTVGGKKIRFPAGPDLELRRKMSLLSQKAVALKGTVWENVAYPLRLRKSESTEQKVEEALKQVNLLAAAKQRACSLSGGEQERMAFARATVYKPELLLLDEFTAHLDPYNIRVLENALKGYLKQTGSTAILVTHNLFQARRIAGKTAFLCDGRIIEQNDTGKFFTSPRDKRTRAFVNGDMVF